MHQLIMQCHGEAVEIWDHHGRVYRGVIDGMDPRGGVFLRDRFFRRVFIPFFLIAAIILLRNRRRIF